MNAKYLALLIVVVVYCAPVCAEPGSALTPVVNLLLDDTDATPGPVEIHPDAGKHLVKPLVSGGDPFGYFLYLPQNYSVDPRTNFPLILFLHGQGEKGNGDSELNRVTRNGPPKMIKNGQHFPALVVSPQLVNGVGTWSGKNSTNNIDNQRDLNILINRLKGRYNIDPKRVYITGLSLGGGGAWDYARLYTAEVAAVVPVAGIGIPSANVPNMANIGVWAFHALSDPTVCSRLTTKVMNQIAQTPVEPAPPNPCRRPNDPNQPIDPDSIMSGYPENGTTYSASRANNAWVWTEGVAPATGQLRMTLYPDGSHNSWTRAYNDNGAPNTAMWGWLFTQSQ